MFVVNILVARKKASSCCQVRNSQCIKTFRPYGTLDVVFPVRNLQIRRRKIPSEMITAWYCD